MSAEQKRGVRRTREGVVVSDAMDKTRVVKVERRYHHPLYRKQIRGVKKFYAHDEKNESKNGDRVRIAETRPLSKSKRWIVVEIVEKSRLAAK